MKDLENRNEVFIEEIINAGIDKVFQALTDPEKLLKWYAPIGCTIRFKELNIEKGGKFHSCISNPQYGDCWCIGVYKEIIPNAKLVFTMVNADEYGNTVNPVDIGKNSDWPMETVVTITLTAYKGKTKLQLHQTVSQELAKKTGAYRGWLQMLNNLQSLLNQVN